MFYDGQAQFVPSTDNGVIIEFGGGKVMHAPGFRSGSRGQECFLSHPERKGDQRGGGMLEGVRWQCGDIVPMGKLLSLDAQVDTVIAISNVVFMLMGKYFNSQAVEISLAQRAAMHGPGNGLLNS